MSVRVERDQLTEKDIRKMDRELFISKDDDGHKKKFGVKKYYVPSERIPFVATFGKWIILPFFWGTKRFTQTILPTRRTTALSFSGQLRPEQLELEEEAMSHLDNMKTCLLAVYPGFGKTITTLSILARLQRSTLIIVNKLVLVEQWRQAIQSCLGIDPVYIQGGKWKMQSASVYIVNAINLSKYSKEMLEEMSIGVVVVDECHLIMTKVFSTALSCVSPEYLIGLSATPYRNDGFHTLFDLYFGEHRVEKELYCPHQVYRVDSGVTIEHSLSKNKSIDWNSVIEKQSTCARRVELIYTYAMKYPERHVLILCKRIKQMHQLSDYFKQHNVETTLFKESDLEFDRDCRILISSYQKVGTGFSHDQLDMLILGVDTEEYFLQYLGRVFRRKDSNPIIVDIVDDHPVLKKHYYTRSKIYKNTGGKIMKEKSHKVENQQTCNVAFSTKT